MKMTRKRISDRLNEFSIVNSLIISIAVNFSWKMILIAVLAIGIVFVMGGEDGRA